MRIVRLAAVGSSVAFAIAATWLAWLSRDVETPLGQSLGTKVLDVLFPLLVLTMVAVGQLIASRHPRHLVAWSFLGLGLGAEVLLAIQGYGLYGTVTAPGSLPRAGFVLWVSTWIWALPTSALVVALLVFPDGKPLSRRWWLVAWVALAAGLLQAVADAFRASFLSDLPLDTPFGRPVAQEPLDALSAIGTLLWSGATLLAAASLVIRFRRAHGDERQQIKWFAYASGVMAVTLVLASFTYAVPTLGPIMSSASALVVLLIPISAAVAIRRYRLYDIDLVIERTLVYGALSASLAATYWGLVLLLQAALRPVTAGSELAVAVSTLASLALVQPLRTSIQRAVDRRFYRSRYDAVRTIDAFAEELRDEVDLESVRLHLLRAVGQTMAPAHTSLWLRRRTP